MPDFSKAQIGDACYSLKRGWAIIIKIKDSSSFPLVVKFQDTGITTGYTINGLYETEDLTPDLYHSRPEITDPPPPKRKREEMIECFGNLYHSDNIYRVHEYETPIECENHASSNAMAVGARITIHAEWEED